MILKTSFLDRRTKALVINANLIEVINQSALAKSRGKVNAILRMQGARVNILFFLRKHLILRA